MTSKTPISVAIVEDNRTIREGLALLLGNTDRVDCVGQFGNCEDMLQRAADLQPDLILMDIGLPGMTGIEGTKALQESAEKVAKRPVRPADLAYLLLAAAEGNSPFVRAAQMKTKTP